MNRETLRSDATSPDLIINVAVDTTYLSSQEAGQATAGIYMMDNNVAGGSLGEGTLELTTYVVSGSSVGFNVFPINQQSGQDSVGIVAMEISDGVNIFGDWDFPTPQPSGSPCQWKGTARMQGQCTYQLKISVAVGEDPVAYYWWDPYLQCTAP